MDEAESPPQKSLVLVFKLGDVLGSKLLGLATWYWPAHEAAAWLALRRELLPGASAQEIVALALLPEDSKAEIVEVLCGLPPGGDDSDWGVLDAPRFELLSESCAVCIVKGAVIGSDARAAKQVKAAIDLFAARVERALPGAMRDEAGLAKELTPADLEHGLRAAYDKQKIVGGVGVGPGGAPRTAPKSKRRPGL